MLIDYVQLNLSLAILGVRLKVCHVRQFVREIQYCETSQWFMNE